MGNMKFWWIFGFEWWGGLMPAEMTTAKGVRYVPLALGLWLKRPTQRAADDGESAANLSLFPAESSSPAKVTRQSTRR